LKRIIGTMKRIIGKTFKNRKTNSIKVYPLPLVARSILKHAGCVPHHCKGV